jgi:ketosteroid isomerase-like protein
MPAPCNRTKAAAAAALLTAGLILAANAEPDLHAFLSQLEDATREMLGGDSTRWKALASHSDDASLFPPFGGVARGWDETRARYEAAATRMAAGKAELDVEVLASGVSGDLAYVIAFERSRFRLAGSDTDQRGFTRVTHILRREGGEWRLLHRHMDHLPETFTPPPR